MSPVGLKLDSETGHSSTLDKLPYEIRSNAFSIAVCHSPGRAPFRRLKEVSLANAPAGNVSRKKRAAK